MLQGGRTTGEQIVEMEIAGLKNGLTKIVLTGRLDTPGADRIEARFVASVVPASSSAIVDISGGEFIASMGIRMFIAVARSLALRHAKLALYGAQATVSDVFENASLKEILCTIHASSMRVRSSRPGPEAAACCCSARGLVVSSTNARRPSGIV